MTRGLAALGLPATPVVTDRLLAFAALIRKWAGSYNLVARGDRYALIGRHVLDSLAVASFVHGSSLLDVGSGAGFPGIPLAIAMPGLEVTLLDASGKKVRFMRHVRRSLGLDNVQVAHARLEDFHCDPPGSIVCRAYGSLAAYAEGVRHLAGPATRILAMKGRRPDRELEELPGRIEVQALERIEVPDLHAERHLVIMAVSPDTA